MTQPHLNRGLFVVVLLLAAAVSLRMVAAECDPNCRTCDGTASDQCTGCNDPNNASLNAQLIYNTYNGTDGVCIEVLNGVACQSGTYQASFGDRTAYCARCYPTCETCWGNAMNECYTCLPNGQQVPQPSVKMRNLEAGLMGDGKANGNSCGTYTATSSTFATTTSTSTSTTIATTTTTTMTSTTTKQSTPVTTTSTTTSATTTTPTTTTSSTSTTNTPIPSSTTTTSSTLLSTATPTTTPSTTTFKTQTTPTTTTPTPTPTTAASPVPTIPFLSVIGLYYNNLVFYDNENITAVVLQIFDLSLSRRRIAYDAVELTPVSNITLRHCKTSGFFAAPLPLVTLLSPGYQIYAYQFNDSSSILVDSPLCNSSFYYTGISFHSTSVLLDSLAFGCNGVIANSFVPSAGVDCTNIILPTVAPTVTPTPSTSSGVSSQTSDPQSMMIPLIAGVVGGVVFLLLVALILILLILRRRNKLRAKLHSQYSAGTLFNVENSLEMLQAARDVTRITMPGAIAQGADYITTHSNNSGNSPQRTRTWELPNQGISRRTFEAMSESAAIELHDWMNDGKNRKPLADTDTVLNTLHEVALPGYLQMTMEQLQIQDRKIGAGAKGLIRSGVIVDPAWKLRNPHVNDVAIKFLPGGANPNDVEETNFQQEVAAMSALRFHSNIITLLGFIDSPRAIVTPIYAGDLFAYLHIPPRSEPFMDRSVPWSPMVAGEIMTQVASALMSMHALNIVHRDIKTKNILLESYQPTPLSPTQFPYRARVCDFGISRIVDHEKHHDIKHMNTVNVFGLSVHYAAPEVFAHMQLSSKGREIDPEEEKKGDIYAFGICLLECITQKVPWQGRKTEEIHRLVTAGQRPPIPDTSKELDLLRGQLVAIVTCCWQQLTIHRPDARSLLTQLEQITNPRYGTMRKLPDCTDEN